MHRSAVGLVVSVAIATATARPVFAGDQGPKSAETLFREGRAMVQENDYPRACLSFAASLSLDAAPGTLLNLADCEEHVGLLADAWLHYRQLEEGLPDADGRSVLAHERASALAPRVPYLTITLAAGTAATSRIFRDDVEIGPASLALALPVNPGTHVVLVTSPGRVPKRTVVQAVEGERSSVAVDVGAEEPRPIRRTTGWIVGAAGLTSIGVGAYFGVRGLSEHTASDVSCRGGVCTSVGGLDAYQSARTDGRTADIMFGLGLVALAVGGYLFLTSVPHEGSSASTLRVSGSGLGGTW